MGEGKRGHFTQSPLLWATLCSWLPRWNSSCSLGRGWWLRHGALLQRGCIPGPVRSAISPPAHFWVVLVLFSEETNLNPKRAVSVTEGHSSFGHTGKSAEAAGEKGGSLAAQSLDAAAPAGQSLALLLARCGVLSKRWNRLSTSVSSFLK